MSKTLSLIFAIVSTYSSINAQSLENKLYDFVQVYNTNNAESISVFIGNHFIEGINIEAETNRWLHIYSKYGALEFHSTAINGENRYRAFYRGKLTKAWVELTIKMSREYPNKIRFIPIGEGLKPNEYTIEEFDSSTDLTEHLDKYLADLHYHDFFSGSVLVTSKGETIYEVSVGNADKSKDILINENTLFNIASVTKVFTATAIFQLLEKKKLSLEDPVNKYVKNYPDSITSKITIRQLLTHTSGIGRGKFDNPIYPQEKLSIQELLPLTIAPFELQPGEYTSYSNGAYILLGAIIENVSEISYYDYIKENIFDVAKMTSSDFYMIKDSFPNKAVGYTSYKMDEQNNFYFNPRERKVADSWNGYRGTPAGLSYSTAKDLNKFLEALQSNELLSNEYTQLFLQPQVLIPSEQVEKPVKMYYGFSWEIVDNGLTKVNNKDGGTWGFSCRISQIPDTQMNIVVLSNYESIGLTVATYITDIFTKNAFK